MRAASVVGGQCVALADVTHHAHVSRPVQDGNDVFCAGRLHPGLRSRRWWVRRVERGKEATASVRVTGSTTVQRKATPARTASLPLLSEAQLVTLRVAAPSEWVGGG